MKDNDIRILGKYAEARNALFSVSNTFVIIIGLRLETTGIIAARAESCPVLV